MAGIEHRFAIFDQMIGLFPPGRLVDLGAGHGMFALRANAAGWDVTAVDGRPDRFPAERGGVSWVVGDIRTYDFDGQDVVACLGLFYHLTAEDQLDLLSRIRVPLILDTHVANGVHSHPLTDVGTVTVDGAEYRGAWYREPGEATSSIGNPTSFWPTPESLARMLEVNGFGVVLEATPWVKGDRTFWLCLPDGYRIALPAAPEVTLVKVLSRSLPLPVRRAAWRLRHRLTRGRCTVGAASRRESAGSP